LISGVLGLVVYLVCYFIQRSKQPAKGNILSENKTTNELPEDCKKEDIFLEKDGNQPKKTPCKKEDKQ
jgi:hypothetical protein